VYKKSVNNVITYLLNRHYYIKSTNSDNMTITNQPFDNAQQQIIIIIIIITATTMICIVCGGMRIQARR